MVDALTAYTFSFEEVVKSLLHSQGVHSGLWTLSVNLEFSALNVSKDANASSLPGAVVAIQSISLQKTTEKVPGLTFDAAKLNPVERAMPAARKGGKLLQ